MVNWHVPLTVLSTIKRINTLTHLNKILTINYKEIIEFFSQNNIPDTSEVRSLLDDCFNQIKDTHLDYHIMQLEGLLTDGVFLIEPQNLQEKIMEIKQRDSFECIRNSYELNINKKKLLLLETIKHITYMQVGELFVFKYKKEVSYLNLWNEFYMEARGTVLDLLQLELVSTPYRKFFNLNEKNITSLEVVQEKLKLARHTSITNKEDGSMISVSKHKGSIVVSTPGSLSSEQAKWAGRYLEENHPSFLVELTENMTYLFEAIYPENRIVIDYQGEEKLVLTNIRMKTNGRLVDNFLVTMHGLLYAFPLPEYESKTLEELLQESSDTRLHPADKKEGWVFQVNTETEDFLFKLKCDDYCEIHKIMGLINSPKVVFHHIIQDTFDDFIVKVPEAIRGLVDEVAERIGLELLRIEKEAKTYLSMVPIQDVYTKEEYKQYKELLRFIKEEIMPVMSDKLPKMVRTDLEKQLVEKACGKEPFIERYYQKEFTLLWNLIPERLRNQQSFRKKEAKLFSFVNQYIPKPFRPIIFDSLKGKPVSYTDLIDLKELDFSFLKKQDDLKSEE